MDLRVEASQRGGWSNSGANVQSSYKYTGTYAARFNRTDKITKSLSTSGYTDVTVSYARYARRRESSDHLYIEWYDGGEWHNIEDVTGNFSWTEKSDLDLPAGADNNSGFQLRFRVSQGYFDYAYIDDVEIKGTSGPTPTPTPTPAPTPTPNPDVIEILTDVVGSTAYQYNVEDDKDNRLDTLKIIENPSDGYLGVYHSYIGTEFQVRLATSTDLLNWTYEVTLAANSSMPTIAYHSQADAYLLVHEQWMNPNSSGPARLKFQYYDSLNDLLNADPSKTYLAPITLSPNDLEGTPNVYSISADGNTIEVGFHYYSGSRDLNAQGTLTNLLSGTRNWQTDTWTAYNNKLIDKGVNGNIGDRDYGWIFAGEYNVQEGQLKKGDWASWRAWLYDYDLEDFWLLDVTTHGGSTAFCNPTFTVLTSPNNKPCVVVTYFLPSEGAAPGELAELIFYTEY